MKQLSIIIPCYQSASHFDGLISELKQLFPLLTKLINVEFVLVDDGSTDSTFKEILRFKSQFPKTKAIQLTANYGAHAAFLAGLSNASGDCFAILHPDLQDPPVHLPEMIKRWETGCKLIIGQRTKRDEGFFKNLFASIYHKTIKTIALPNIPDGGYDLILFDAEIRDKVVELQESNISQVYLISSFNFPYETIPITRLKSKTGKSTWTFSKKYKLFMDSIVGFSYFPIKVLSILAMLLVLICILSSIALLGFWLFGSAITSFMVLLLILSFFSAILGVMLAIVGEYLWRTLEATRKRPPYFINKMIDY